MKKFQLLPGVICVIMLSIYFSFKFHSEDELTEKQDVVLGGNMNEKNRQEELENRAREEFLKTVDPALGYVPMERLIKGEIRAKQIMESIAANGPMGVSSLTWTERGPNNIGGRTRAFMFDKSDVTGNTAFAGSVAGGLWRTTNFKTGSPVTWTQISTINQNLAISCIAQDPVTLSVMYAGTGEGFNNIDAVRGLGVYKSTDGGLTWALLASTTTGGANANDFSYVQDIIVYNNATHDVYAACRSAVFCNNGGLMRSSNGGSTWSRVIGTYPGGGCSFATDFKIFDIEVSSAGDLWVSSVTEATGLGKIWKSPAGATVGNAGTWVDKTPTGTWQRIELACSPTTNDRIYALLQGGTSAVGGIRRTDDGAAVPSTSWIDVTNSTLWCDQGSASSTDFSRNQAWYDLILGIKPTDDATVFAGGVDIMRTTSAGIPTSSWTQLTQWNTGCASLPTVHADIHNIVYLPGSSTEFVVANDGGLYYTADGGTTFTAKNTGYNVTQYYSCAIHPSSGSNYMLAGAQDNGTHKFTAAGMNSVTTPTGGDGGFCEVDQKNPLQQITNYTGTTLNISNNGGSSFTYTGSFSTNRFINPGEFDTASSTSPALSTSAYYYCGGASNTLRRVTINFSTLSVSSSSFTVTGSNASNSASAIKVDPNTPNRVWIALSTASGSSSQVPQLYYASSANATPTFTAITLPAAITSGQYISSIDVENGNASHILITLSNFGIASIYESTDLGASWTSLDNNGVNLPDVPVRWGKFLPSGYTQSPTAVGGILLATELGVWGSNTITGLTTPWAQNSTGIGNVRTDMIRLRGADKVVAVATHGRGLFTGLLNSPLPVSLVEFRGTLLNNKTALLQWTTSSEFNSKQFELERSFDGINYRKITTIAAAGNSNSQRQYSYTDRDPLTEYNYYRLRSVDIDNQSKLSQVVLLKPSFATQDILVIGNPFKNNIQVRFVKSPAAKGELRLTDITGKLIARQSFGQNEQQIEFRMPSGSLASGVYLLQAVTGNEKFVRRILKE